MNMQHWLTEAPPYAIGREEAADLLIEAETVVMGHYISENHPDGNANRATSAWNLWRFIAAIREGLELPQDDEPPAYVRSQGTARAREEYARQASALLAENEAAIRTMGKPTTVPALRLAEPPAAGDGDPWASPF